MKKYLAHIRGHYQELGFEEFFATLEAENIQYSIEKKDNQVLLFNTKQDPVKAAKRCAFLHSILKMISIGNVEKVKLELQQFISLPEIEDDRTFAVRIKKIGKKVIEQDLPDLERELGDFVYNNYKAQNLKVNLKNPDYLFFGILIGRRLYFGLEVWVLDHSEYESREPGNRPFFRPGSMKTEFARAIVNLSRIKQNEMFYDPFCGGGGFLIEAATLGANVIGSELDKFAVYGCNQNMKFYKNTYCSIIRSDSRHLPIKEADAIATDPPYAIQSSTHGENVNNLIYDFLIEAQTILKKDSYLVFSSPAKHESELLAEKAGYSIQKILDTRLHKSLTRRIIVLK
ncbi:MAG: RsmD family RNA methyltransferase [Candidatus Heimdallarchaeota archaeon]|nr:RsmD family RNA methyltransferase [Candidatus Heimdallarchaeota archaeon]MCK4253252.1 RsmD family RNA methyltransferase [Candidatus Heimdallarchaeota archaeon]